jgi:hypothetical protein
MVNNKNNIPDGFHNAVLDAFQEIDSMSNNTKQINKNRVLKVVAVAAVSGILLSISAFAYTEISNWFEKTGKYSATVNNSEIDYNEAYEHAKFELGYLPDEFTEFEPPYKYHYNGEAGLSLNMFRMGSERKNEYKNVISTEKTTFGENEAEILTLNENEMSLALIYFEKEGVVVECYFNNHIPKDELNKILSNLKVVEATEDDAFTYDYESVPHSEFFVPDAPETEKIIKPGEICENGWDFETDAYYNIKIVNAEILDNANEIDKRDLHNAEEFNNIVNNDGTLKGYNREEITYGDGVNTIDTIKDVKFVERKLVAVTIEATNINNTTGSLFCSTYSLVENQNNISNEVFALTSENDNNPQFYFVSVDANGTQTITIYYLVDGDVDFSKLCLQVNNLYTQSKCDTYSLLELGL